MQDNLPPDAVDGAAMAIALEEARAAALDGEVPVGCVIMVDGSLVSRARNRRERDQDPTAHAELMAIRDASLKLGRWRLSGATLYVTLEPCAMCAGAMVLARIDRLVFGARDPKGGAVASLYEIATDERLNHRLEVRDGVGAEEASALLRQFFRTRRS